MLTNKLTGAGAAAEKTYVEDVFSTYLYTGNGSTQTINNGIDLAGKGGMVWIKDRTSAYRHNLFDTSRGITKYLDTSSTFAENGVPGGVYTDNLTAFNSNGFTLGADTTSWWVNHSPDKYTSWTFRKAPKFFDVVTWTGDGSTAGVGRLINHSLGITPGMIMVKCTSASTPWIVTGTSGGWSSGNFSLLLNTTDATGATASYDQGFATCSSVPDPTTQFRLQPNGQQTNTNASGQTYVAYLFAHDTTTDGMIQCGSYTESSSPVTVNLGWEPQYLLVKRANSTGNWVVIDNMRALNMSTTRGAVLFPNLTTTETNDPYWHPTATGFTADTYWGSGAQVIYMAIRRPMKVPTDGTKVFSPNITSAAVGTKITTGFPIDLQINARRALYAANSLFLDRLRGISTNTIQGAQYLVSSSSAAEVANTNSFTNFWDNTGYLVPTSMNGVSNVTWNFQRAPSFFDVVCYTGTGVARTVNHNLGVAPELMIVKNRGALSNWIVYAAPLGATKALSLNATNAAVTDVYWNNTEPTSTVFSLLSGTATNASGSNYVAYLFASCPGVSKVGTFTYTGSALNVNCGFTNGARFVLFKTTDVTGDWWVFDTARGITASVDAALWLNNTLAENGTSDRISPYSPGFSIPSSGIGNGTYIYLAIA